MSPKVTPRSLMSPRTQRQWDRDRTTKLYREDFKYRLKAQLRAMRKHYQQRLDAGHDTMQMGPWKWEKM